jgi:hypothetical protein
MSNMIADKKQLLNKIKESFKSGKYQYTRHGVEQRIKRTISRYEIEEAILSGEIIEDYPDDKYGHSCLISGTTNAGRPLHIQVSLPQNVKVITVYQPDTAKWIFNRIRRSKS